MTGQQKTDDKKELILGSKGAAPEMIHLTRPPNLAFVLENKIESQMGVLPPDLTVEILDVTPQVNNCFLSQLPELTMTHILSCNLCHTRGAPHKKVGFNSEMSLKSSGIDP